MDQSASVGDNIAFATAYEKLFKPYRKWNSYRFYRAHIKTLPLTETERFLKAVQRLVEFIKTTDTNNFDIFEQQFKELLNKFGLQSLLLPKAVPSPEDGLFSAVPMAFASFGLSRARDFCVDWTLLTNPVRCTVLYLLISRANDFRQLFSHHRGQFAELSDLVRKMTPEENRLMELEIEAEWKADIIKNQAKKMQRCAVGHDVDAFRKTFIQELLKQPRMIDDLIFAGYFHVNMHRREECEIGLIKDCDLCYDRDMENEMGDDDSMGVVWTETINALGGRKTT